MVIFRADIQLLGENTTLTGRRLHVTLLYQADTWGGLSGMWPTAVRGVLVTGGFCSGL